MTLERFLELIGWFDGRGVIPTHDPIPGNAPHLVPTAAQLNKARCLRCEAPFYSARSIATFSLVYVSFPNRSYFYRLHQNCCRGKNSDMDDKAFNAIDKFGLNASNLVIERSSTGADS